MTNDHAIPPIVDRATWQAQIDALRVREKAHTREGDAIAAARRRLPMVEIEGQTPVHGPNGLMPFIDVFEGRNMLFASYHMWHAGKSTAEQCPGCTLFTNQIHDLTFLHSRDVTVAVLCEGPFAETDAYRAFMGWELPWYAVPASSALALINDGHFGMTVCYLRQGNRVFETYWTTDRGDEILGSSYLMLDRTVYGRQEAWEDSPAGWPRRSDEAMRSSGRPIAHWSRLTDKTS